MRLLDLFTIDEVLGERAIQKIIFHKLLWSNDSATNWLNEKGFTNFIVTEDSKSYICELLPRELFKSTKPSYMGKGIYFVIGILNTP